MNQNINTATRRKNAIHNNIIVTQEGKEMNAGDARKLILKIIEEQSKGQNPQYLNVAPGPPGPPRSPGHEYLSVGAPKGGEYINIGPKKPTYLEVEQAQSPAAKPLRRTAPNNRILKVQPGQRQTRF